MTHNEFTFDAVFDEEATNEGVYAQTAAPLVAGCYAGGFTTCMVYGQVCWPVLNLLFMHKDDL